MAAIENVDAVETAPPTRAGRINGLPSTLGPGLITGTSDDDPSGIGTYAVAGASLGYATLWTALVSFPMMTAVQFTCARIGMVSGTGLALVVANTVNAVADIGAIAATINLLLPIPPLLLIVPIGATILALQIWGACKVIENAFKWLTLGLLAYVGSALFAHPDWTDVLWGTFVPRLSLEPAYVATLVAIFSTTISPYIFLGQRGGEVEDEVAQGRVTLEQRRGATQSVRAAGQTHITSAAQAAEALRPLAGDAAALLLALRVIGSGFLAVPVLTARTPWPTPAAETRSSTANCVMRAAFTRSLRRALRSASCSTSSASTRSTRCSGRPCLTAFWRRRCWCWSFWWPTIAA